MTTPYFVRLAGADGIPASSRIAAEIRFLMELERGLGGPRGVMAAWPGEPACEAWNARASAGTPALSTRWDEVFGAASGVALGEVAVPGAHFEFSPVLPSARNTADLSHLSRNANPESRPLLVSR